MGPGFSCSSRDHFSLPFCRVSNFLSRPPHGILRSAGGLWARAPSTPPDTDKNMLISVSEHRSVAICPCPPAHVRRAQILVSIQLVCGADVLAFGAEAQTTSLAPQRNNILMDWLARTWIQAGASNHYRSDPVQVQSTRMRSENATSLALCT